MKVLFINRFPYCDYLNDCVFHGLCQLPNVEVFCTARPDFMLETVQQNPSLKDRLYGKGFTLYATLTKCPKIDSPEEVREKIAGRFYDKIVYGSIHRDQSYSLEVFFSLYKKDQIVCIDGEDHNYIHPAYAGVSTYYKRELFEPKRGIQPISFAIPEEKIYKAPLPKEKLYGTVIPGDLSTYVFEEETAYYKDYAVSYYGKTWKKGGWDCMRHYEILAARSIPCFVGLENCPKTILTNFPKKIVLEINKYSLEEKVHPNYSEFNELLHTYTQSLLTTKVLAQKILQ